MLLSSVNSGVLLVAMTPETDNGLLCFPCEDMVVRTAFVVDNNYFSLHDEMATQLIVSLFLIYLCPRMNLCVELLINYEFYVISCFPLLNLTK